MTLTLAGIKGRKAPECAGLDIPTKRSINLMILSFAQQLYLDFNDRELADLAKEANEKSVGATNYGDQSECDEMLRRIRACLKVLEQASDFAGVLQERAKLIGDTADFADLNDAVPMPETVATLYQIGTTGTVKESQADLLGQNFWGLANVLSR